MLLFRVSVGYHKTSLEYKFKLVCFTDLSSIVTFSARPATHPRFVSAAASEHLTDAAAAAAVSSCRVHYRSTTVTASSPRLCVCVLSSFDSSPYDTRQCRPTPASMYSNMNHSVTTLSKYVYTPRDQTFADHTLHAGSSALH